MSAHEPRLRLSGYSTAERLDNIFASLMVDVAHIVELNEDYALVVPDEPEHTSLNKADDREWLIQVIAETMKSAGENNVAIELLANQP